MRASLQPCAPAPSTRTGATHQGEHRRVADDEARGDRRRRALRGSPVALLDRSGDRLPAAGRIVPVTSAVRPGGAATLERKARATVARRLGGAATVFAEHKTQRSGGRSFVRAVAT